jgi:catechol 2,3-dioxygenase-like lactoylglutathione lyase family enzyme
MSKPKIKHLAIVTLDPEKLAKFYTEVFDMEIQARGANGGIFVTDGYLTVALLQSHADGKPAGLNHFGFAIDDADEIAGRLKTFGLAEPVQRPADRPYAETRATDPDGNNFDLSVHGFEEVQSGADRAKASKKELAESAT